MSDQLISVRLRRSVLRRYVTTDLQLASQLDADDAYLIDRFRRALMEAETTTPQNLGADS